MSRLPYRSNRAVALGLTGLVLISLPLLVGTVVGASSAEPASMSQQTASPTPTPTEHDMDHDGMDHEDGYGYSTPKPTPTDNGTATGSGTKTATTPATPTGTLPGTATPTPTPTAHDERRSTRSGSDTGDEGPSDPLPALVKGFQTALEKLIDVITDAVANALS